MKGLVVIALCAALAGCRLAPALEDYCPDDPMRERCPGQTGCSGPFECVAYCIEYFPEGGDAPERGLGSWCDDRRLPESYETFCSTHADVRGCASLCNGDGCPSGGDAGLDGDSEGGLACSGDDECDDPGASRCFEGSCSPCYDDGDCAHMDLLPACTEGLCSECSSTNDSACGLGRQHCEPESLRCVACIGPSHCDDGIECSVDSCVDFDCVFDSDLDDDGYDCVDDCDDGDALAFPGNAELCDEKDNDCSGEAESDFAVSSGVLTISLDDQSPSSCSIAGDERGHALVYCDGSDISVALIDERGAVTSRLEIAGPCDDPDVARRGDDFVVVVGSKATIISREGEVLLGPRELLVSGGGKLASNGEDALAIVYADGEDLGFALLTDDLSEVGTDSIALPCRTFDVATSRDGFLVACGDYDYVTDTGTVWAVSLDLDGRAGTPVEVVSLEPDSAQVSAAWLGDGFLVTWTSPYAEEVRGARLNLHGVMEGLPSTLIRASETGFTSMWQAQVRAANGRGGPSGAGLVLLANEDYVRLPLLLRRLDADGRVMEGLRSPAALPVGSGTPNQLDAAPAATGLAVAFVDSSPPRVGFFLAETCF